MPRLVGQADPVQQLLGALPGHGLGLALDLDRRLHDVLEGRHVREEVEALEDHADVPALEGDLAVLELVELVALLPVADQLAVDVQPAGVDLLQVVDAPQEGRLAGAGRADQAEDLARRDLQVDALEDVRRRRRTCGRPRPSPSAVMRRLLLRRAVRSDSRLALIFWNGVGGRLRG